jgi:uncharacterized protein YeaO (DUF488 family)
MIRVKRAYDAPAASDGARFLVDRLWPRGVKKESLKVQDWLRAISPSNELRTRFGHEPDKWKEFQRRYFAELDTNQQGLQPLLEAARDGDVTLVFSARDTERNNAVALKNYLEEVIKAKRGRTTGKNC